jgi:TRAP-type C4-dicarboxylate transport system permease small subunit
VQAVIRIIKKFLLVIVAVLVAANAVTICVSVFCRFVINYSLGWPDEMAAVSLVWITFLGAALATIENRHIAMSVVREKFDDRTAHALEVICDVLMIGMCYILLRYGTILAQKLMGDRLTSLPIPKGIIYGVIPFSAAIMIIALLYQLYNKIKPSRKRPGLVEAEGGTEE